MKLLPPPGPARTRQLMLFGLLLLGVIYTVSRLFSSGAPASAPATVPAAAPAATSNSPARPAGGASTGTAQSTAIVPVELGKLEPVAEEPGTARNPFRFGTKPAPPPPPAPTYVAPPAPPPRIDPIPLKFIGRLVMPDKKVVASFSDGKGNVVYGVEGQIVDGRYRVVRIGEESVVIEYLNGTGRTTLPLRGS